MKERKNPAGGGVIRLENSSRHRPQIPDKDAIIARVIEGMDERKLREIDEALAGLETPVFGLRRCSVSSSTIP